MAQDTIDKILHKFPGGENGAGDALRVMTVRMPAPLHAALRAEAHDRKTSANRLAVAKLSITGDALDKLLAMQKEESGDSSV